MELFASHNGDFFHGFEAVGHETGAEDVEFGRALFWQLIKQGLRAGLDPLGFAKLALERNDVFLFGQAQCLRQQFGSMVALVRIGVAVVMMLLRNAVETQHQFFAASVLGPIGFNMLLHGLNIGGIVVITGDGADAHLVALQQ